MKIDLVFIIDHVGRADGVGVEFYTYALHRQVEVCYLVSRILP